MSDELPRGWASSAIKKFADINPRHPKGLDEDMLVTFAPMAGISESRPDFLFTEERPLRDVRKGFTHFAEGDVLFAKITPCMENGKGAVARGLRNKIGCGTTELHVVRPLEGISPEYIYSFLAQRWVRREAKEHFTGSAGQARVPTSFIEELEIPLAPLDEQRRIVAKLQKLLIQVDACQSRLRKIPLLLKRFRQSVLIAACSGRLTADWRGSKSPLTVLPPVSIGLPEDADCVDGWGWKMLTSLARLESGHTPRKTVPEYWEGGEVPWICLQDIRAANGKVITDTILNPTMHGIDNSSARMLPAGTVVFSRDISVGYVAIMGREMATSQHFADWICGPELNNRFLMYALMASRDHLVSSGQGSTVGTIYMPALKEFHLLTPPFLEQKEIVRRVEKLFALADRIEARFVEGRKRVDSITQAILAKAFRGELVPTEFELAKSEGRSFESAEELLERIRQHGDPREKLQKPPQTLRAKETLLKKNRHLQKAFRGEL